MLQLRKTTNLTVSSDLVLNKTELQSSFFYLYGKKYKESSVAFLAKLWMSCLFPEIVKNPKCQIVSGYMLKTLAKRKLDKIPSSYLKTKKITSGNNPYFEVSLPLYVMTTKNIVEEAEYLNRLFNNLGVEDQNDALVDYDSHKLLCNINQKLTTTSTVINNYDLDVITNTLDLDFRTKAELSKTFISVDVLSTKNLTIVYLILKINSNEAQQLTSTPWLEIRNIDIYPLLMTWVNGLYGFKEKAPLASFPISRIAKTLPKIISSQVRVNKFNLGISHKGIPLYIPSVLNNTNKYEDLFSLAGMRDNNAFSLLTIEEASDAVELLIDIKIKLPANIPVLIDWTNNKYSYTNTSGLLHVQDLSRLRVANVTHAVKLLSTTELKIRMINQFIVLANAAGVNSKFGLTSDELNAITNDNNQHFNSLHKIVQIVGDNSGIDYYFTEVCKLYKEYFGNQGLNNSTVVTMDLIATNSYYIIFRPVARFISAAYKAILENLEVIYSKYSVSYVMHTFAYLTLIAEYTDDLENLKLLDINNRAAAINQGVELEWVPDSIPLLGSHVGRLPHQIKVANILKGSPEFAILPQQAGSGKTLAIITDILLEIKNNRNNPYLVMCPSSLVSQYLKEVAFFTSGKLNAIAINSYTVNHNGLDRLTDIISKAPINTIIVCSYDVLSYKQQTICYGTHAITVSPIIEFLSQFNFQYFAADEVHFLKNKSNRSSACMSLITDIPKKRLASGTMVHDSPSDLAMQIAILDPTLFGTRDEFNDKYGQLVKNDRVILWKPKAQSDIMQIIKSRIVVAKTVRKEWVALLPEVKELFHRVELTPAQHAVYGSILEATLERINEEAKTNKVLAKFLNSTNKVNEDDDEATEDLSSMLTPYLARLEQFITAPSRDPLGEKLLSGLDTVSPKVNKIIEIIYSHLANKIPGKILIFTNYVASAEDIYDKLPQDLKIQTVLYTANNKVEASAKFELDDNYQIMVGVEQSMNTGVNLQFSSNLIRVETCWNPGTEEQGNSRINRPELKTVDRRINVYFNRVICNQTIDITKISRLIAKIIAKVKFDNADNNLYAELEDVDIIPMTLDSIQALNNWDSELVSYATVYAKYKAIEKIEYAEYKELHGSIKLQPVTHDIDPVGSMLLAEVPYSPGLELANSDKLALVRLDQFLSNEDLISNGNDEVEIDNKSEEVDFNSTFKRKPSDTSLRGKPVHTEFGDGLIRILMGGNKVSVDLNSGNRISCKRSSVFVITKPELIVSNVRQQLLELVGLPITKPSLIVSPLAKLDTVSYKRNLALKEFNNAKLLKARLRNLVSVDLHIVTTNGYLGLAYFSNKLIDKSQSTLLAMNFRLTPSFKYAAINNLEVLSNQCKLWKTKGLFIDKKLNSNNRLNNSLRDMYNLFDNNEIVTDKMIYNYSVKNNLPNFYNLEVKPSIDKSMFKLFSVIENNMPYLVLPIIGQAGTKTAIKNTIAGLDWKTSEPSIVYYGTVATVYAKIKELLDANIKISNLDDLKIQFKAIKNQKFR